MSLRTFATPLTIGTFIVVSVTGLCMLFGIRGLTGPVHEVCSILFVIGSILHIAVNWKPTLAHLKKPLGASLAVLFVIVSVVALLPRRSQGKSPRQILQQAAEVLLDADIKGAATITRQSEQVLRDKLTQAGFKPLDAKASLREIAKVNGRNSMDLLRVVLPAKQGRP